MKKSLLSILAASALWWVPAATAETPAQDTASYFSFLTPADRETLVTKGELTASGEAFSKLPFGPRAPFAPVLNSEFTVASPTVAQEGLYLFARPAGDALLKVYNALNAVSSMAGVQYYSLSQKKMETLILASWRVDSVDKPAQLPDLTFTSVPASQKVLVFQKDNRLGDGFSELTYKAIPGGLSLTMKNASELKYLFLPLVAPGNLQMVFVILPLADKVVVYAALQVKTASLLGLEHSKDENFRNRMRALAGWLGARIAALK
jgi:hypothetical protein